MRQPEQVQNETFDYEAYEDIRQKLQMPGYDRRTVYRELAGFCGQRIGQTVTISGKAEVFRDKLTNTIKPYGELLLLTDEAVRIADATEHGLFVDRESDGECQPALEWESADTFPTLADFA